MSEEDLERYESEIELALVHEYRAVLPMFAYVVETERRFYLANKVEVAVRDGSSPACVEVTLSDAWVWDMYRPARFVPSVRILTFRDVNIERLPEKELCTRAPIGYRCSAPRERPWRWLGTRTTATRSSNATGAVGREKSISLCVTGEPWRSARSRPAPPIVSAPGLKRSSSPSNGGSGGWRRDGSRS